MSDRYHLTLTRAGRPVLHGWWGNEQVARKRMTHWVGAYGGDRSRVTLTDEETGETLTEWPEAR